MGANLSYHSSLSGSEYEALQSYQLGRLYTAAVGEQRIAMRSNLAAGCTELVNQTGIG